MMKNMIIMLVLIGFSCKSVESTTAQESQKNVLLQYSKGPCLGKCPVYELWIHEDGSVLYKGLDKVANKGEVKAKLTSEELSVLRASLEKKGFEIRDFKRIRDFPITRLKFGSNDHKFYVSQIKGPLKKANTLIESIVNRITEP